MKSEPAFPTSETRQNMKSGNMYEVTLPGLSKREYFAGLAMQGYCSISEYIFEKEICEKAVKQADALLKELEKDE